MEYVHIVVALILAVTVVVRCVCVIADMKFKSRTRAYCPWAGFGISYALLCVAAAGSFFHIAEGAAVLGDWLWLVASAGLIAFDRRKTSVEQMQKAVPMSIVRFEDEDTPFLKKRHRA